MNHGHCLQEDRNQAAAGRGKDHRPQGRNGSPSGSTPRKNAGRHPSPSARIGTDRIVITARTYTAKYRDGSGIVREVATGCRDESAARSILGKLERRAVLVKGEVLTAAEDAVIDHQGTPLADHIAAFIDHQKAKGVSRRVKDTLSQLRRVAADCGFRRLADLDATALERWLLDRKADGMRAGTTNQYRSAWVAFGNWCVRNRPAVGQSALPEYRRPTNRPTAAGHVGR